MQNAFNDPMVDSTDADGGQDGSTGQPSLQRFAPAKQKSLAHSCSRTAWLFCEFILQTISLEEFRAIPDVGIRENIYGSKQAPSLASVVPPVKTHFLK